MTLLHSLSFFFRTLQETQTDPVYHKGPLQLMLSATDGTHGSTQVTHVAQADKVIFVSSMQHTYNLFDRFIEKEVRKLQFNFGT